MWMSGVQILSPAQTIKGNYMKNLTLDFINDCIAELVEDEEAMKIISFYAFLFIMIYVAMKE
jgi:hypothetical protein